MNRQQWVTCGKFMYVAAGLQLVGFLLSALLVCGFSGCDLDGTQQSALVSVFAWAGAGYTAIRYATSDSYGSGVQTVYYQTQVDSGAAANVKTPMITK
eukprot:CAMPEP_0194267826 /NCGR_PEP_ID=MMETSP0169-20130528/2263_1 /TAXON_ID=218684 /ORGANISM="Corethron pennatum, Strain L29A3" /LENGTH=97 /DNA_ID=CAMNT_0039008817 /DNA_START=423 /DNA_END=716 /DNA_ORIENTATION=-